MNQAEYASWMINPAELEAEKERIREAEEYLLITSLEVQGFKPSTTIINNNQESK